MSTRSFGMDHRTVVPENFERPAETAEESDAESDSPAGPGPVRGRG